MVQNRKCNSIWISDAEHLEQSGMRVLASVRFMAVGVKLQKRQPNVPFGTVPQTFEEPQIPCGGGRAQ
jgi:hypothetical protein